MTTQRSPFVLHDHAGLRWIAPFGLAFILTLLTAIMMFAYPHISR